MVAQLFALTKNHWVVPLQNVNFTTVKLLNKKKKEKKQIMESYYRCKEWSLSFLLQDEQLLITQQNPEPIRTSQEIPLSLNKTSEWKFQRCRFCLDIRKGLLTVTKAPKSKKDAVYEGTPWPCVQAQGLSISSSEVQGFHYWDGENTFTFWGCLCPSRSRMVFATFQIHPEWDVCVLLWDLLMKDTRETQRLPEDLDSDNNRNSAAHRLQLCLHNNSN